MNKLQNYLEQFYKDGEVLILDSEWTNGLDAIFQGELKKQDIQEIRVYQALKQPEYKVICRIFQIPSVDVQQIYSTRSRLKRWLPIMILVFIYFLIVAIFAKSAEQMLSFAFLIFLPFSLGAIVEYICIFQQPSHLGRMFFRQFILVIVLLILGAIFLGEGVICLIMAAPIFLLFSILGALAMHLLCRKLWKPYNRVYSIALLPLFALLFLPNLNQYHIGNTQQELVVNAPVEKVFSSINNIQNIKQQEIQYSPIFTMGFPKPISGMTLKTDEELIRYIEWQRGIRFQEKIIRSDAPYRLMWSYVFSPTSFPKGSLDDHVKIGGKYFNLLTTDYELQQVNHNQTRLILRIDYRLSTEVNWYANLWVKYVLNEFSQVILHIYKNRLENI